MDELCEIRSQCNRVRRGRFLVISLLVLLTTFAATAFLVRWQQAQRQRETLKWVRNLEGIRVPTPVYYAHNFDDDWNYSRDTDPPGPQWLREILGPDFFDEVVGLQLYKAEISDARQIATLTSLRALGLDSTPVKDLAPLRKLKELEVLGLSRTPVKDIRSLTHLANLESLFLAHTQVSDITPLAMLKQLRELDLNQTLVSDVTSLTHLMSLERLHLTGTRVSQSQVDQLRQALPNCEIEWSPPTDGQPP